MSNSVAPQPTLNDDTERDKLIRHAQYLIDRGYLKNVELSTVIAQLEKAKAVPEPSIEPKAKEHFSTFGDLEDFM